MINKKGFLLAEETLKMVISVIVLGFLAFLLFSIYSNARANQKLDQAKETLPFIIQEAKAGRTSVDVYNPEGWYLRSYQANSDLPRECSNFGLETCICICDKIECDEGKHTCIANEGYMAPGLIPFENLPSTLNINQENKYISR